MKEIIGSIIQAVVRALVAVKDFFSDNVDLSDPFMKVIAPYSRQGFSENVRNGGRRD